MGKINGRAIAAEFIGVFFFLFLGVGSVVASSGNPWVIAVVHGVAIAILASATMSTSGGQLNPAVTLGLWLDNRLSLGQVIGNIVGQVVGAVLGCLAVKACFGEVQFYLANHGLPTPGPETAFVQVFLVEAIMTFALMFVVWGVAVHKTKVAAPGLFIGLTVMVSALVVGGLTGSSLNPARYLGPAFVSRNFEFAVPYITGPVLGAALAVIIFKFVLTPKEPDESAASSA